MSKRLEKEIFLPLSRFPDAIEIEMRTVALPDGERVPVLGQGTWRMGERKNARPRELGALRLGIELGMSLIDTAEMYGDGGAEELVAEAIHGQQQDVFVVTKVYPYNASRTKLPKACERSLKRRTRISSTEIKRDRCRFSDWSPRDEIADPIRLDTWTC